MEELKECWLEWNQWLDSTDQDYWMSFVKWYYTYKICSDIPMTNLDIFRFMAKEHNIPSSMEVQVLIHSLLYGT